MVGGLHFGFADSVVAVECDIQIASKKEVLGIAGDKIKADKADAVLFDGVADKIFIEFGGDLGYGAQELERKDEHGIIIHGEIFVESVDDGADALHVDVFSEVDAFMAEDHLLFSGGVGAGVVSGYRLLQVSGHQGSTGDEGCIGRK